MLLALIGALGGLLLFAKLQDRQLAELPGARPARSSP
jgi:putative membrane protein